MYASFDSEETASAVRGALKDKPCVAARACMQLDEDPVDQSSQALGLVHVADCCKRASYLSTGLRTSVKRPRATAAAIANVPDGQCA